MRHHAEARWSALGKAWLLAVSTASVLTSTAQGAAVRGAARQRSFQDTRQQNRLAAKRLLDSGTERVGVEESPAHMANNAEEEAKKVAAVDRSGGVTAPHDLELRLGRAEDWHPFEGVGALSAGASSRLLIDYPLPQRQEILDLLFKPGYGASLQVLKIEIGGDMQSTDGSEPSHMHYRDEKPDCTRGYESWLLKEAKARNPAIRTYALAWGVPGWIGDGEYFSHDNIRYHISFLMCIRDTYGFEVDYLGIWNEMRWGQVWYIDALAQAFKDSGLRTRLVLLDAVHGVDEGFVQRFSENATFRSLIDVVGMHYPCEASDVLAKALSHRRETRFWASEELSTVADWGGAGCWGRLINQNFVRMNATSSIAWSLVWSAYPNLECFGNGLLYAFEPWSGHYDVMPPIWTMAHTTQFTAVGWQYLAVGDGSGLLPEGGTYVTTVSADLQDLTIVLETLTGQCFYHSGCFHAHEAQRSQQLRLRLGNSSAVGPLPRNSRSGGELFLASHGNSSLAAIVAKRGALEVWMTNRSSQFQRLEDVTPDAEGVVTLTIPADSIVTLSTMQGSRQGSRSAGHASHRATRTARSSEETSSSGTHLQLESVSGQAINIPISSPFPLPYSENFDEQDLKVGVTPRYFADQGGAFEVVKHVGSSRSHGRNGSRSNDTPGLVVQQGPLESFHANKVLEQVVVTPPIAWIGHSPEPLTLLGDVNWTDIGASVSARLGAPPQTGNSTRASRHAGLCVRLARYHFFGGAQSAPQGYCLRVVATTSGRAMWLLDAASVQLTSGALDTEVARRVLEGGWVELRLEAREARLQAWVNEAEVASVVDTMLPMGQVALACGYHRCQFDDLHIKALPPPNTMPSALLVGSVGSGEDQPIRRTLVRRVQLFNFDYTARTCDPPVQPVAVRQDFTGFVGLAFVPKRPLRFVGLGRLAVSGGHAWAKVHNVSLYSAAAPEWPIASVALPTAASDQEGVEDSEDGWVFVKLRDPILVEEGLTYYLVSSELANGDTFYDHKVRVDPDDDVEVRGPVYFDTQGWHNFPAESQQVFGPLNAILEPVEEEAYHHQILRPSSSSAAAPGSGLHGFGSAESAPVGSTTAGNDVVVNAAAMKHQKVAGQAQHRLRVPLPPQWQPQEQSLHQPQQRQHGSRPIWHALDALGKALAEAKHSP